MRHCNRFLLLLTLVLIASPARATDTWTSVAQIEKFSQVIEQSGKTYALSQKALYVSSDDQHWQLLRTTTASEGLNSIVVLSSGEMMLFGYNFYLLSTDQGATWKKKTQAGFTTRRCISDIHDNLYAGTGDVIMLSTDKGASWDKSTNGTTGDFFDIGVLVATANGDVYAGNQGITGGSVYRSTDAGASWSLINKRQMEDVASIAVSGQSIFVAYSKNLVYSDNNGATWKVAMSNAPMYLTKILFVGEDEGYLGTLTLGVMHSHNHGLGWENGTVTGITGKLVTEIFQTSRGNVLAGTDSGLYLHQNLARVSPSITGLGDLVIAPNPALPQSTVQLFTESSGKLQVTVYNETGKLEMTANSMAIGGSVVLNTSELSQGMHYVLLSDGKRQFKGSLLIR